MIQSWIFVLTLFVWAAREIFLAYQMNALLNKLMSRNYHEYQLAQTVGETVKHEPFQTPVVDDFNDELAGMMGLQG